MKKALILPLVLILFVSCNQPPIWKITLSNSSKIDLTDVPVVIQKPEIEENLGSLIGEGILLMNGEEELPIQLNDLDKDGNWDELITLLDLSANQTVNLSLKSAEEVSQEKLTQRTNIRMAQKTETEGEFDLVENADRLQGTDTKYTSKYFQYEGPGWENDKIAFRNYFDERNGMDIFGKTTSEMALHKVGVGASYHELQDWGMDILKVGNSLGSGAIALLYQDSLYRVTAPENATYQLVNAGPLRSSFDLDFAEVKLADRKVKVKHRVSITAGVFGYQSEVFLEGEKEGIQIVSGIVNIQSEEAELLTTGEMNILYTYDNQAFGGENLGMALMASNPDYQSWYKTPDKGEGIVQTYAMVCQPDQEGKATFLFLAGWELSDSRFKTKAGFEEYLLEEANRQVAGKF